MGFGNWDADRLASVRAMVPEVEGRPCVNVGGHDGPVFLCRGIGGIVIDEDSVNGACDWVEPADARPDELTDGLAVSCDCLRIGPGWWQDADFGWCFVFDPALVARSLSGDHSWVGPFIDADRGPSNVADQSLGAR